MCFKNNEKVIKTWNVKALMLSQWDRDKRDVKRNRGYEGNPKDFHLTVKLFLFYCTHVMAFSGLRYCTSIVTPTPQCFILQYKVMFKQTVACVHNQKCAALCKICTVCFMSHSANSNSGQEIASRLLLST